MTGDVVLRDVWDEDLPIFFEQQTDPAANHMVAFTTRDPTDRAAFMAHWARILGDINLTIRTVLFDDQVAGNVAQFEHEGKPEVSYFLGKQFWGKGIATAALSHFLVEVTVRPLYAGVAEDNVASIHVLEKCGFVVVGRKRNFAKARGVAIEEVVLRLDS